MVFRITRQPYYISVSASNPTTTSVTLDVSSDAASWTLRFLLEDNTEIATLARTTYQTNQTVSLPATNVAREVKIVNKYGDGSAITSFTQPATP